MSSLLTDLSKLSMIAIPCAQNSDIVIKLIEKCTNFPNQCLLSNRLLHDWGFSSVDCWVVGQEPTMPFFLLFLTTIEKKKKTDKA